MYTFVGMLVWLHCQIWSFLKLQLDSSHITGRNNHIPLRWFGISQETHFTGWCSKVISKEPNIFTCVVSLSVYTTFRKLLADVKSSLVSLFALGTQYNFRRGWMTAEPCERSVCNPQGFEMLPVNRINHPGGDAMVIYLELRPRTTVQAMHSLQKSCVPIYGIYMVWVEKCCIPYVKIVYIIWSIYILYIIYFNIFYV